VAQIIKRGLSSDSVDGSKLKFSNNESFRARNFANASDISLFKLNASDTWEFQVLPVYSGSNIATESYVTTELGNYVPNSEKGANNGVATLDGGGKVPAAQLPSSVMTYEGVWNANTNSPSLADGTGDAGMVYRVGTAGSQDLGSGSISYGVGDYVIYNGSIWEKSDTTDAVASVNGQTGIVSLDTDDISEGSTNLYYTAARFNTAFSGKSTTDLAEGTNLYHTTSRARTAAVVNSTAGNETDQAASVAAMKSYVATNAGTVDVEVFTLVSGDITNGYIDLAVEADKVIEVTPKGFPPQHPVDDYTLSVVSLKTRITFAGDMLSLIAGDKIKVAYSI
jgi:hypothetical protein